MNKIKLIISIFLLSILSYKMSTAGDDKVYITETGKKYHKRTCSNTKGKTGVTLVKAKADGYTPCDKCMVENKKVGKPTKTKKKINSKKNK